MSIQNSCLPPPKKVNCIFIADQEKRVNRILRNTLFVSTYIMKTSALPAETSVIPSLPSIRNLTAYEITSRHAGTVDITRIAVLALVEIILIGIEDVLYASIHLQGYGLKQRNIITHLQVQVEEIGRRHILIRDIVSFPQVVLHQHVARIRSRQGKRQTLHRRKGGCQVTIQIRCAVHPFLRSHIVAPLHGFLIAASL